VRRGQLADVCLDTPLCNGHTTGIVELHTGFFTVLWLWFLNEFFRVWIRILLFSWFLIRILFRILKDFFLIFLTLILPLYSSLVSECARLHIMTRYKLLGNLSEFVRVILLQIHFGSGAARILIRNDFFRIRSRIRINNTSFFSYNIAIR
jgi:hypothetical protein